MPLSKNKKTGRVVVDGAEKPMLHDLVRRQTLRGIGPKHSAEQGDAVSRERVPVFLGYAVEAFDNFLEEHDELRPVLPSYELNATGSRLLVI